MFCHGRRSVLPSTTRLGPVGTSADDLRIGAFEAFDDMRLHAVTLELLPLRHLIGCLRALLVELENLAERLAANHASSNNSEGVTNASQRRQASSSWSEDWDSEDERSDGSTAAASTEALQRRRTRNRRM